MRNFSSVVPSSFVSFNVNEGEYISDNMEIRNNVLCALAVALGVPHLEIVNFLRKKVDIILECASVEAAIEHSIDCLADYGRLSPSEVEVVIRFAMFSAEVLRNEDQTYLSKARSRSFVYHNLNTGKSVVWTHAVL